MNPETYNKYIKILSDELVPALGCTEPIAIAYVAAKAREVLGSFPERIVVKCSGNIIKNAKGVMVPGTGNMKGIEISAILGVVAGDAAKKLEVLNKVKKEDVEKAKFLLKQGFCELVISEGEPNLEILVTAYKEESFAEVEIKNYHTNITKIIKNDKCIYSKGLQEFVKNTNNKFLDELNTKSIYEFANKVSLDKLIPILDRQIKYNMEIANEGLQHNYGVNVGKTLIKTFGNDVKVLAKAYPAAGSDARMGGCTLPVIINSGSGNQGLTASLPVIIYGKHLNVSKEILYRALTFSNLMAIYLKSGIGSLSAYCGVVTAACASGAAITYLHGGSYETITKTITNTLGNVSGIVCDGAKASCAAKIASAVDAALMGHYLAMDSKTFSVGEGLIKENIDKTIWTISKMGRDGMKQTDIEILNLMIR